MIMPAYNSERYIAKAIESVLQQSYRNIELIIVDDCSSDNTRTIIKEYASGDARVRYIRNAYNMGCAEARNVAIRYSSGTYISFIDSDDVWLPDKLKKEIERLEGSNCDVVYTSYAMINADGIIQKNRHIETEVSFDMLLKENFICFSTVLIRSCIAKRYSMVSHFFHEDYCFLLGLLQDGFVFSGLDEVLVYYRVFDENRSGDKLNAAKYRWLIYRKYLKLNLMQSVWYFTKYALNGIKKYYL